MIFAILLNCLLSVLEFRSESVGFLPKAIARIRLLEALIDKTFDHSLGKALRPFRIGVFDSDVDQPGSTADCDLDSRFESIGKLAIRVGRAVFLWRSE